MALGGGVCTVALGGGCTVALGEGGLHDGTVVVSVSPVDCVAEDVIPVAA